MGTIREEAWETYDAIQKSGGVFSLCCCCFTPCFNWIGSCCTTVCWTVLRLTLSFTAIVVFSFAFAIPIDCIHGTTYGHENCLALLPWSVIFIIMIGISISISAVRKKRKVLVKEKIHSA